MDHHSSGAYIAFASSKFVNQNTSRDHYGCLHEDFDGVSRDVVGVVISFKGNELWFIHPSSLLVPIPLGGSSDEGRQWVWLSYKEGRAQDL